MNETLSLFLLAELLLLSAFFSGSETALFSLSRMDERRLLERHPRRGKLVKDLLLHPRRALITVLIGNNIVNTAAAAIVTLLALRYWGPQGVGIVTALFTVVLIFCGEVFPKVFAIRNNESVAIAAAPLLEILSVLLFPLRRLIRFASDWILSLLLKGKREPSDLLSSQELKVLIQIGEEEGILNRRERRMIQKLFELGERPARSIMTPRIDVVALRVSDPWPKQVETMQKVHFSHFPVYQESLDQILGVISTQEVILSGEERLEKFIRPTPFLPESKRIDELLRDFQKTRGRFAVCVDEYGGTAGVVTLEDVLEEIFGEFYDEYARTEQPIRDLGSGEYLVEAKISLSQFNEFFKSRLSSKEAETFGGLILEHSGRVPRKGDSLEVPGFQIRIQDMARQRITRVLVRKKK